jgi:hypothetical protein
LVGVLGISVFSFLGSIDPVLGVGMVVFVCAKVFATLIESISVRESVENVLFIVTPLFA